VKTVSDSFPLEIRESKFAGGQAAMLFAFGHHPPADFLQAVRRYLGGRAAPVEELLTEDEVCQGRDWTRGGEGESLRARSGGAVPFTAILLPKDLLPGDTPAKGAPGDAGGGNG